MATWLDHLWQSALFALVLGALAALLPNGSARVRAWLWRAAAIKFLVPFSLLYALGSWIGFPVRHVAIPPPSELLTAMAAASPWVSPLQTLPLSGSPLVGAILLVGALTTISAALIEHELRRTRTACAADAACAGERPTAPAPLGMFQATAISTVAFCSLAAPMLAGAVNDRVARQAALAADVVTLRAAPVALTEVPRRFGSRPQIHAEAHGVAIRSVNLKDLVALVYGIDGFEVFGGSLPWLETPHYDVRVTGTVKAPDLFDAYALRQPVTQYLYDQYGVSIRVNGDCQEPCLNQESFVIERIPWTLSKMIRGESVDSDR